jgi:hypothetical protein
VNQWKAVSGPGACSNCPVSACLVCEWSALSWSECCDRQPGLECPRSRSSASVLMLMTFGPSVFRTQANTASNAASPTITNCTCLIGFTGTDGLYLCLLFPPAPSRARPTCCSAACLMSACCGSKALRARPAPSEGDSNLARLDPLHDSIWTRVGCCSYKSIRGSAACTPCPYGE